MPILTYHNGRLRFEYSNNGTFAVGGVSMKIHGPLRERKREREKRKERKKERKCVYMRPRAYICVCMSVRTRKIERRTRMNSEDNGSRSIPPSHEAKEKTNFTR